MSQADRSEVLLTGEVRELLALIKDTDIAEVLIERGDAKLHIKRAFAQPALAPTYAAGSLPVAPVISAAAQTAESPESEITNGVTITAPMVGTYYSAPSPKEPPYVQVGDEVKPGDVIGIVEAMKIMNEIECEVHGRVAKILAQNGQPVEYGQSLLVIEPLT